MDLETKKLLLDIQDYLCKKVNTDKISKSKSEMQAYNRGVVEGIRIIDDLLDSSHCEWFKEIGIDYLQNKETVNYERCN